MKIKLMMDVPVDKKHGLFESNVYEVTKVEDNGGRGGKKYWVIGRTGENVAVWPEECEVVSE